MVVCETLPLLLAVSENGPLLVDPVMLAMFLPTTVKRRCAAEIDDYLALRQISS
jgi:hypothetical protein